MRYLLFPTEEESLFRYLTSDLRLVPLNPENGQVPDVPTAIPHKDDWKRGGRKEEIFERIFWASEIGGIRRLGDAPSHGDPADRVTLLINKDADPDWRKLVDTARTPVIRWVRPRWYWTDRSCIIPGRLGAMSTPIKNHPPDLMRLVRRIERYLKKGGERLNCWDVLGDRPFLDQGKATNRPKSVAAYWVSVWPLGMEWVKNGGLLYPWDA